VADAQTEIATCSSSGTPISCVIPPANSSSSPTVKAPSSIQAVVTLVNGDGITPPDQYVQLEYTDYCLKGGLYYEASNTSADQFAISTGAPVTETLTQSIGDPVSCEITFLHATLEASSDGGTTFTTDTTGSFTMALEWTPSAASASSPVNVPLVKGYHGMCLDDKGNSSANRTEVIIWTCNSAQAAQGWTFTNDELVHNGKCANDRGNGGSGTTVILWTCNRAPDETWSHTGSDGEFVLDSTSHGQLCLTDPGHSTADRTRLIVYPCRNTSNQHWT
jgi:hypothetical protein